MLALDETCPIRAASSRTCRIVGSSATETSSGRAVLWNGPPAVYGSTDHTSKWTVDEHVECGSGPGETQSRSRMKVSGRDRSRDPERRDATCDHEVAGDAVDARREAVDEGPVPGCRTALGGRPRDLVRLVPCLPVADSRQTGPGPRVASHRRQREGTVLGGVGPSRAVDRPDRPRRSGGDVDDRLEPPSTDQAQLGVELCPGIRGLGWIGRTEPRRALRRSDDVPEQRHLDRGRACRHGAVEPRAGVGAGKDRRIDDRRLERVRFPGGAGVRRRRKPLQARPSRQASTRPDAWRSPVARGGSTRSRSEPNRGALASVGVPRPRGRPS